MFRGLRLAMTGLYLLTAVALLALLGFGTYQLLDRYFVSSTDLALQQKMAHTFRTLGCPLPPDLQAAEQQWNATHNDARLQASQPPPSHDGDDESHGGSASNEHPVQDDSFDAELAAIYVLPLDQNGQVMASVASNTTGIQPNQVAVAAALRSGSDWRTVQVDSSNRVRLLTYKLPTSGAQPAVLQLGRVLSDQDRVLSELLTILIGLGAISVVLLGGASWWLAGRSLKPAQAAWERQQAFVANASHELRAPLTLMRASTEVALRSVPATKPDERELLEDVLNECDHMNHLVEDLLLLSRLDAGRLKLERKAVPLHDMLSDVQRQVGRVAGEKGVELRVQGSGMALGDATRMRQVLLILLDNALRYTPRGGTISMEAVQQGRHVALSVEDTGAGIPAEHLPHIFDRFYRADESHNDRGGTGLGLSIARSLVEAQHGHIAIASQVGKGTRVTITLASASPATTGGGATEKAPSSSTV